MGHVVSRDSVSVESSRPGIKSECADIFHQSFLWLLRHTNEPPKGRNSCLWLQFRSVLSCFGVVLKSCRVIRDLKQPGRVRGRRREKTSEVWVENVVQSGKKQMFKQAPVSARRRSRWLLWMASFKEVRELLIFSVESNTINEEEFFLLSEGFKSVSRLSNENAWIESNRTELVFLRCATNADCRVADKRSKHCCRML